VAGNDPAIFIFARKKRCEVRTRHPGNYPDAGCTIDCPDFSPALDFGQFRNFYKKSGLPGSVKFFFGKKISGFLSGREKNTGPDRDPARAKNGIIPWPVTPARCRHLYPLQAGACSYP
jgi:hypothetical protein